MASDPTFRIHLHYLADHDGASYSVDIRRRDAEWHGLRAVKVMGNHRFTIEPRVVDQLQVAIEMLSFFDRDEDGYLAGEPHQPGCSDYTAIELAVEEGPKDHRVGFFAACGPHPLMPLVRQIEDAANVPAWR